MKLNHTKYVRTIIASDGAINEIVPLKINPRTMSIGNIKNE
jgi:hypothetical protein